MSAQALQSCVACGSARFLRVKTLSIEIATPALEDRHRGEALVCRGCGRLEFYVERADALLGVDGVEEVAVSPEPYR
jgi:hypothetical protein